jgi:2-octaprenyl-6-methoxyphenol hydroxylase
MTSKLSHPPCADVHDVVICGASFAGLALARALSLAFRGDIRIAIVDPAAGPSGPAADGRAFAVWAASKTVLEGLGVWSGIAPQAQPMTAIEISDSALQDGVRPTRITYDARIEDGQPAAYMVPSAALHAALYGQLAGDPAIEWVAPAEAETLELGTWSASVTLKDGRNVHGRLCVAADGRSSRLRDRAGIKTVGWDYGQTGIVATVRFELPHDGIAIQHFLPGGPFAILPLRDNRACITWSASRDEATAVIALEDTAFLAELECRIGGRFGAIRLDGPRRSWPLNFKMPRQLTAPRFALIGDAAHGVHPVAGQGVNLALRDVAALAEVIADSSRLGFDAGYGPALDRYARWRRFDSTMSAGMYDALNRLFSVDNAVLRAGRGAALGVLDRLPDLKRLIIDEAAGLHGELPRLMRGAAL